MEYVSDGLKLKIGCSKEALAEAEKNCVNDVGIKRFWRLVVASVKCNFYLFGTSLSSGECEFRAYDKNNRIIILGTTTGSMFDGNLEIKRIFLCSNK